MPSDPKFTLWLNDLDYKRIRQLEAYDFGAVKNRNNIGTFVLDIPYDYSMLADVNLSNRIEVVQDDVDVIFAGPINQIRRDKNGHVNKWEISGFDDNIWLAARTTLPEPTGSASANITGVSTTVATDLINKNSHGLTNGAAIYFTGLTGATTGIENYKLYYVVQTATNSFKVSSSADDPVGNPIDLQGSNESTVITIHRPRYHTSEFDEITNTASNVLSHFVNLNLGPGALTDRRLRGFTLPGTDPAAGTTITGQGRFDDSLLVLLQNLANNDGLVFEIRQVGQALEWHVTAPDDKTASVKFSEDLANLGDFSYQITKPKANFLYGGGPGNGIAKIIQEASDSDSIDQFDRYEDYVDAGSDIEQMPQKLAEQLVKDGAVSSFTFAAIGSPFYEYGVDYKVGDLVTAVLDEQTVADAVQAVNINIKASSQNQDISVYPTIGSANAQNLRVQAPSLYNHLVNQSQRLRKLEKR